MWSKQRGCCNKHTSIQHPRCLLSEVNDNLTVALTEPILLSINHTAMILRRDMHTFTSSANVIESQSC